MFFASRYLVLLAISFSVNFSFADSNANFDLFKSLKGTWSIKDKDSGKLLPVDMVYDLGSRDTIVTEQFGKELSVFYQDQKDLLMTHYCNRGNQPRLKLATGIASKALEFEMIDITNLENPDDPHVQKIIYQLLDPTHLDLELVWKIGSQYKSEKYALTKK